MYNNHAMSHGKVNVGSCIIEFIFIILIYIHCAPVRTPWKMLKTLFKWTYCYNQHHAFNCFLTTILWLKSSKCSYTIVSITRQ